MSLKKVELLIEDRTVDMFGDESFSISYSIDDINDIGRKAAAYSKEITLPATDINNEVFTSLFEVTTEGGFNPISRKRAALYVDGVLIMQGYFKLLSINIQENEYPTYTGQLFEEQINFISALDELYLENLSIPITGITTDAAFPPYVQVDTFQLTGLSRFPNAGTFTGTGGRWTDALVYTGVTFGTGSPLYGVLSQQPRDTKTIPFGTSWVTGATNMLAYEALIEQYIELDVNLTLETMTITPSAATYRYKIIKSNYASPAFGAFLDQVLAQGTFSTPTTPTVSRFANITLATIGTRLMAGDKIRIEVYQESGTNSLFRAAVGSSIGGRIFTGTYSSITTGYTVSMGNVIRTIATGNTSDDFPIAFPLIDYSKRYNFVDKDLKTAYQYKPNNELYVNIEDLRPVVFAKRVWDAIFQQSGFKYKSKFINSDMFKRLVIAGGVDDTDISALVGETIMNESSTFNIGGQSIKLGPISLGGRLGGTQDQQFFNTAGQVNGYRYNELHMGDISFSLDFLQQRQKIFAARNLVDAYMTPIPAKDFDHINAHKVVTAGSFTPIQDIYYGYYVGFAFTETDRYGFFFTAATNSKYRMHSRIDLTARQLFVSPTNTVVNIPVKVTLQIQKLSIGSYKYYPNSSTTPSYDNWQAIKQIQYTIPNTGTTTGATFDFSLELDETFTLKKGDMVRVIIIGDPNRQITGYAANALRQDIEFYMDRNRTFCRFYRHGTVFNGTISNAASLLPRKFKQREFILELAKMFNLYFEVDKEDPRTLIIEPRDTYYEDGIIRNWERKIDYTKDFTLDILSHELAKTSTFKYADDDSGDYLSTLYGSYSGNNLVFGSYIFTSPNEYNVDNDELESKFAPTYTQKIGQTNIKITKIHASEIYEPDYSGAPVKYKIKPRLMLYKKMPMPAFSTGFITYLGFSVPNEYTPLNQNTFSFNDSDYNHPMTEYGYAGHLNDPNNPTFDLNWFTDFNYLPGTTGTTQNLFNVFYKQQMIELSDQTARKLTCHVELNSVDIANLRFNDIYFFNDDYWRLIEISDYDTSSDVKQTTKCTFIKVVRAQTNQLIDYATYGYLGINGGTGGGLFGGVEPE